ncbi:hypothetical protein [Olleya sp. R77988]|uniref:hypothetical protein n=1 Tax=Olleya sp. R77988 TaxID=3093875 RepID=UPI0037CA2906
MNYWSSYENGSTIQGSGSEGGVIILDEENILGARITLEKNTSIADCAITLGVYGVMFHTDYFSTFNEAKLKYEVLKIRIQILLNHIKIEDNYRDSNWKERFNLLIENLI